MAGDFYFRYRIIGKVKCKEGGHELSINSLKRYLNPKFFNRFIKENLETYKKSEDSIPLAATASSIKNFFHK